MQLDSNQSQPLTKGDLARPPKGRAYLDHDSDWDLLVVRTAQKRYRCQAHGCNTVIEQGVLHAAGGHPFYEHYCLDCVEAVLS